DFALDVERLQLAGVAVPVGVKESVAGGDRPCDRLAKRAAEPQLKPLRLEHVVGEFGRLHVFRVGRGGDNLPDGADSRRLGEERAEERKREIRDRLLAPGWYTRRPEGARDRVVLPPLPAREKEQVLEPDLVERPKRLLLLVPERTGVLSVASRFQVIAVRLLRQRAVGGRVRKSSRVYGHLHPGPNKKPQPTKGRGLPSGFDHGGARGPASSPVGASRGAVLTVTPGPLF